MMNYEWFLQRPWIWVGLSPPPLCLDCPLLCLSPAFSHFCLFCFLAMSIKLMHRKPLTKFDLFQKFTLKAIFISVESVSTSRRRSGTDLVNLKRFFYVYVFPNCMIQREFVFHTGWNEYKGGKDNSIITITIDLLVYLSTCKVITITMSIEHQEINSWKLSNVFLYGFVFILRYQLDAYKVRGKAIF